jgi:hypothetical protein
MRWYVETSNDFLRLGLMADEIYSEVVGGVKGDAEK